VSSGTVSSQPDLGIFARVFRRTSPAEVAQAVAAAGFGQVQLNLSSFGQPTIPGPDELARLDLDGIRAAFAEQGIGIWGVSLTFNLIDPDAGRRAAAISRARAFLARIPELGADFATICTGTRDPADMWRAHPGNDRPDAWADLRAGLDQLLPAAGAAGIRLGIEPEQANVVSSAAAARRLLDELGPDAGLTGIVLDPANLVQVATAADQDRILTGAFDQLADEVVCLHAKDVVESGYAAAGVGLLDYDLIFRLRAGLPRPVPVIVQDVTEADAPRVRELLTRMGQAYPRAGS
jgi:sugar phosphate isomerase/epimerase